MTEIRDLIAKLCTPNILVVGDIILDRYIYGTADRISQEAPVPILREDRVEHRLGGAASVAMLAKSLGADVVLVGVVGADDESLVIDELLGDLEIPLTAVTVSDRPTTLKTRVMGHSEGRYPHQIARIDREVTGTISSDAELDLAKCVGRHLSGSDVVLISDYAKGACAEEVAKSIVKNSRAIVDPPLGGDWSKYNGAMGITPNRKEFSGVKSCKTEWVAHTLDKDGIDLYHDVRSVEHRTMITKTTRFPAVTHEVCDVTGAGDTVLAMLGVATSSGLSIQDAVKIANVAAGLQVQKIGVSPITRQMLCGEQA